MYKCKQNLNSFLFRNIFTRRARTKYALLQNERSIQEPLWQTNFSQYCISYRGPILWNKIAISKKDKLLVIVIPSKRLNVNLSDSFYQQN